MSLKGKSIVTKCLFCCSASGLQIDMRNLKITGLGLWVLKQSGRCNILNFKQAISCNTSKNDLMV